jgi:Tfp pilus assembly protein PilZ
MESFLADEEEEVSQTSTSQILVRSVDRRQYLRQKASSVTYIELGDDNGGILLNLAGGGLSLQAAAKLNLGQELTLRFGLFNDADTISVAGRVIWLSATRKEAGVCFVGLSETAGEIIGKWLAAQEAERISAEWKVVDPAEPEPAKNEIHLLPQLSPASGSPKNPPMELNERSIPSFAATSEPHLSDSFLDHAINRAKTSPVFGTYVPNMMPTRLTFYPKEQTKPDEAPTIAPAAQHDVKQPIVRLFRPVPPERSNELRNENQAVPSPVDQERVVAGPFESPRSYSSAPSASIARENSVLPSIPWLNAVQVHRRTIQISAGVAACIGILLLLFMTSNLEKQAPAGVSSAPTSAQDFSSITPVPVTENSRASLGTPGAMTASPEAKTGRIQNAPQPQSEISAVAATGAAVTSDQSVTAAPIRPQIVQHGSESSWLETLRQIFFGVEGTTKLDPAVTRVPVWADQHTGFYYCDNGPYFAKPERVSLLSQGDALQSGFQPKLGAYCY